MSNAEGWATQQVSAFLLRVLDHRAGPTCPGIRGSLPCLSPWRPSWALIPSFPVMVQVAPPSGVSSDYADLTSFGRPRPDC